MILTGNRKVYVPCGANRHNLQWTAVEDASGYGATSTDCEMLWTAVPVEGISAVVCDLSYGFDVEYRIRAG